MDASEADPLGYSFFVFQTLAEQWFAFEPDIQEFFGEAYDAYRLTIPDAVGVPEELLISRERLWTRRSSLRDRIQEHSTTIMIFGDQQGIDMAPLLRFMRVVEDRCKFSEVNEQETFDALERAHLRYLALRPKKTDVPEHFSKAQKDAFKVIFSDGPILGKNLAKEIGVEYGTLKRHVLPPLRPLGVKNSRARGGYFIDR